MTDAATLPLPEGLPGLRAPFPASAVGKLPRITCKDCRDSQYKCCGKHSTARCDACGNKITTEHMHLDYVGHAEVTDRLLTIDPDWAWEPVAFDDAGAPLIRKGASGEWTLWIRLTVLGVTRLGVGTVSGGFDAEKQLIGDALRNAAMRFGVALDLWAKTELESASLDAAMPPPAPTPAQLERQRMRGRIGDLSSEHRQALGAFCDTNNVPRLTSEMSDDQLDRVRDYLDTIAPIRAAKASAGDESAPETAPAADAAPEPSRAAHAEPDVGVFNDRLKAATAHVGTLDDAHLIAELGGRNLKAGKDKASQRRTLAGALAADPAWQPAAPTQETIV